MNHAGLLGIPQRLEHGQNAAEARRRFDPLQIGSHHRSRVAADLAEKLPQEGNVDAPCNHLQSGERRVGIVEIREQQPRNRWTRAIGQHGQQWAMSALSRRLQHMLQNRVIALCEQQESFDQFRSSVIAIGLCTPLQAGQNMGPL